MIAFIIIYSVIVEVLIVVFLVLTIKRIKRLNKAYKKDPENWERYFYEKEN